MLAWPKNKKFSLSLFTCVTLPFLLFHILLNAHHWIPRHDTLQVSLALMPLWRSLKFSGLIPLWHPTMQLGIDPRFTHLQINLHPSVLFIGSFLRWVPQASAITLFYLSAMLDELVLLLGVFLLGRHLFKQTSALLFLMICALGTVNWLNQPFFCLYFFYALPLSFFFVASGLDTGKVSSILLGYGVVLLASCLGNAVSTLAVAPVIVLVFHIGYALSKPIKKHPSPLVWDRRTLFVGLLLFAFLTAFLTYAIFPEVTPLITSPGRLPNGQTTYDLFLTFADDRFLQNIYGLFAGALESEDGAVYSGLLTLPLAWVGLLLAPKQKQLPFLAIGLFVLLLYFGSRSFVTPFMALVPTFRLFRYSGASAPLLKVPLWFLAAYGWQFIASTLASRRLQKEAPPLMKFVILLFLAQAAFVAFQTTQTKQWEVRQVIVTLSLLLASFSLYLASCHKSYLRRTTYLLLLLTVVDAYSYRSENYHKRLTIVPADIWSLFDIQKENYIPTRNYNILDQEAFRKLNPYLFEKPLSREEVDVALTLRSKYRLSYSPKSGALYNYIEPALGIDPCSSIFRSDALLPEVSTFFDIYDKNRSAGIMRAMGCESPKVQLYSQIQYVSDLETQQRMRSPDFDGSTLLLHSVAPTNEMPQMGKRGAGTIRLLEFTANRVRFEVSTDTSSPSYWLYYADAWHPNWTATVNNSPTPITRANLAFKAIKVLPGVSEVVLSIKSTRDSLILIFFQLTSCLFFAGLFLYQLKTMPFDVRLLLQKRMRPLIPQT